MNHTQIQFDLEHSFSLKLLRSQNAALVVGFLQSAFKAQHRTSVPYSALLEDLEGYLEAVHEESPGAYKNSAQNYLTTWCDDDHRFLTRRYLGHDEPVFELTTDTERALSWLNDLQRREFIGAESRFLRIFSLLEEISVQSSADPETRLAYLEAEKAKLQAEIDGIKTSGEVPRYSTTQLKERFSEANQLARQLLADFKEIEENFRGVARRVQAQQLEVHATKGKVLESVLEADAELRESDQGRSFYTFWQFLASPEKQAALRQLVEEAYALNELGELTRQQGLKRIKEDLLLASSGVIQSNRHLAEQLRRLLDEQALAENKRVLDLIAEIKQLAVQGKEVDMPETDDFITLETRPALHLVMERPLWEASDAPTFEPQPLAVGGEDLAAVDTAALYSGLVVDRQRLEAQIESLLVERPHISLAELLRRYPAEQGLSEIITYLNIAAQGERHTIDETTSQTVVLKGWASNGASREFDGQFEDSFDRQLDETSGVALEMPQVVFVRSGE